LYVQVTVDPQQVDPASQRQARSSKLQTQHAATAAARCHNIKLAGATAAASSQEKPAAASSQEQAAQGQLPQQAHRSKLQSSSKLTGASCTAAASSQEQAAQQQQAHRSKLHSSSCSPGHSKFSSDSCTAAAGAAAAASSQQRAAQHCTCMCPFSHGHKQYCRPQAVHTSGSRVNWQQWLPAHPPPPRHLVNPRSDCLTRLTGVKVKQPPGGCDRVTPCRQQPQLLAQATQLLALLRPHTVGPSVTSTRLELCGQCQEHMHAHRSTHACLVIRRTGSDCK
jgi:hypothetical protein